MLHLVSLNLFVVVIIIINVQIAVAEYCGIARKLNSRAPKYSLAHPCLRTPDIADSSFKHIDFRIIETKVESSGIA